ncbi:HvfC/BufC N-terminal domain-containing protein [Candidatus Thiodiazotropha sp. CDECU1]|uniref:HvfC/BufC N-terminal domain-containing protein n=1 Tax=Candidatus Thiodiazotropha sp. CDECU1 TaxID=3065865 RepID=UPI00292FA0AD|nr:DNA-binding domain-containing protein [Candidatus Thiodiazotropha sp. CDECU1]
MNNLGELQARMQRFILDPGSDDQTHWVSGAGRATPRYQLEVYANAYVSRLKEVLANDYPALSTAIDCDRFDQLAESYIQQHPSRYFSLRDYGAQFPDYIERKIHSDPWYRDMGWLSELAWFELTLGDAFDAADCGPLAEEDLTAIAAEDWPLLRFEFSPSLHRLDLEWNVPAMWKALTADPPQTIDALRETGENGWLIWRQDLVTRFRYLEPDERLVLDSLRNGATFNDACELLAMQIDVDRVSMRAAGLLKGWIQQGLIVGVLLTD